MTNQDKTVLVTGGSGFIATHCILKLAAAGYKVKSTVRNLERVSDLNKILDKAGSTYERLNKIEVDWVSADLTKDEGWSEAVKGCDYVMHVASPVALEEPKDENDLIVPAKEGTMRVLKAAAEEGIKKIVLTSSVAAIIYGHEKDSFNEEDWTDTDAEGCSAYNKSKTYAEKAAWDFINSDECNMELSVINPSLVLGPVLESDFGTSVEVVKRFLNGGFPLAPNISFGIVDVRDVAQLHLLALESPQASGNRFIASSETMAIPSISMVLREKIPEYKKKLPKGIAPNFLIKLLGLFSPLMKTVADQLGKTKELDNSKAKNILGWQPRSGEEAVVASAKSLIEFDIVKSP